jgi:6-phosphofructokinase 2
VLSKVGAGDSFAGAFVRALALGLGLDAALVHGTAAAAAAVMTPATELCRRADFERLLPEVRLQVLSGGGEAGAASAR